MQQHDRADDERRRHPRQRVDLPVTLLSSGGDALAMGRAVDLCRGGARVDGLPLAEGRYDWSHTPLVPEALVHVAIQFSDATTPLVFRSQIQWRKGGALGVRLAGPFLKAYSHCTTQPVRASSGGRARDQDDLPAVG